MVHRRSGSIVLAVAAFSACAAIAWAADPVKVPDNAAPAAPAASASADTSPAATALPAGSLSLDGIWMFDTKHSDDPRKVMEAARPQGGGGGGEGGGGGRRWGGGGGGGGGGMGGGGFGGGGGGGRRRGGGDGDAAAGGSGGDSGAAARGPSPFSRVMRPANKVVIEMLTDQVKVTEDEGVPRPYAIQDSVKAHGHDLVTEGTSASWKSGKLEMTQTSGNRGSIVETYELSKDGSTLTIRAHRTGGNSNMPNPTFVRVYTRYNGE